MDYVIWAAKRRGLMLTLTMGNFWNAYRGPEDFVLWATGSLGEGRGGGGQGRDGVRRSWEVRGIQSVAAAVAAVAAASCQGPKTLCCRTQAAKVGGTVPGWEGQALRRVNSLTRVSGKWKRGEG